MGLSFNECMTDSLWNPSPNCPTLFALLMPRQLLTHEPVQPHISRLLPVFFPSFGGFIMLSNGRFVTYGVSNRATWPTFMYINQSRLAREPKSLNNFRPTLERFGACLCGKHFACRFTTCSCLKQDYAAMEGDEDPCKPLAAKTTPNMIPQKVARRRFIIRQNSVRHFRSGRKFVFIAHFYLQILTSFRSTRGINFGRKQTQSSARRPLLDFASLLPLRLVMLAFALRGVQLTRFKKYANPSSSIISKVILHHSLYQTEH